jgi:hypothetical protein
MDFFRLYAKGPGLSANPALWPGYSTANRYALRNLWPYRWHSQIGIWYMAAFNKTAACGITMRLQMRLMPTK